MKRTTQLFVITLAMVALLSNTWAQSVEPAPAPTQAAAQPISAADFQALKEGLAAAQQQIRALQDELHRRDQAVQQAQSTAEAASAKADAAQVEAVKDSQTVDALQTDVAGLKSVNFSSSRAPMLQNAVLN
ncbi:MAG: hypothetical protein WAK13_05955, partial [Terriglobales bacterium]